MMANLIVDQQAMATSFNTRGDRHSGSLDCHRATLTAFGRFQEKTEANINTLVDKCQILCTQVESLGDNVCRWAQKETFRFRRFLLSCSLGVGNVVVVRIGRMLWSMLMVALKDLIVLLRLPRRMWFLFLFLSLLCQLPISHAHPPISHASPPISHACPPISCACPLIRRTSHLVPLRCLR